MDSDLSMLWNPTELCEIRIDLAIRDQNIILFIISPTISSHATYNSMHRENQRGHKLYGVIR